MYKTYLPFALAFGAISLLNSCSKVDETIQPTAKNSVQDRAPAQEPCGAYIGVECPGGNTQYLPSFYSSEGTASYSTQTSNTSGAYNGPDNPNGYIYDLKIVWQRDGETQPQPIPGYTVMPLDLNRGTGLAKLYLSFTRNPSAVKGNQSNVGPITGIEVGDYPEDTTYPTSRNESTSDDLQRPWTRFPYYENTYNVCNLNQGFDYLNPGTGNLYGVIRRKPTEQPIEVGIIHGATDQILAPSGWTKVPVDLNLYAGGSYIYFCYKNR